MILLSSSWLRLSGVLEETSRVTARRLVFAKAATCTCLSKASSSFPNPLRHRYTLFVPRTTHPPTFSSAVLLRHTFIYYAQYMLGYGVPANKPTTDEGGPPSQLDRRLRISLPQKQWSAVDKPSPCDGNPRTLKIFHVHVGSEGVRKQGLDGHAAARPLQCQTRVARRALWVCVLCT